MLFFVNRKIFNSLTLDLQTEYVEENIINEYGDIPNASDITASVVRIIRDNEAWHTKYGVIQPNCQLQCNEDTMVPAWSTPSGYGQYRDIVICPFDWSYEDNGDFNYCFFLAQTIKEKY